MARGWAIVAGLVVGTAAFGVLMVRAEIGLWGFTVLLMSLGGAFELAGIATVVYEINRTVKARESFTSRPSQEDVVPSKREPFERAMPIHVRTDPPQSPEMRLDRLEGLMRNVREQVVDEIDDLRKMLSDRIAREVARVVAAERERQAPLEQLVLERMNVSTQKRGVAFLIVGLVLATVGNVLSMYA